MTIYEEEVNGGELQEEKEKWVQLSNGCRVAVARQVFKDHKLEEAAWKGDDRNCAQNCGVVIERVTNVWGSTAGAGSDFFDIYRKHKYRELDRLERMDRQWRENEASAEFQRRREERIARESSAAALRADKRRLTKLKRRLKRRRTNGELVESVDNYVDEQGTAKSSINLNKSDDSRLEDTNYHTQFNSSNNEENDNIIIPTVNINRKLENSLFNSMNSVLQLEPSCLLRDGSSDCGSTIDHISCGHLVHTDSCVPQVPLPVSNQNIHYLVIKDFDDEQMF